MPEYGMPDAAKDHMRLSEDKKIASLREGKCPACGEPVERRPGMFFARNVGSMAGLVCTSKHCTREGECGGSLWDDPGDSFMEAVKNRVPPVE